MVMDILRYKKEAKTNFCNLVEDYKIINEQAKELNIPRRKCMKTKEELEKKRMPLRTPSQGTRRLFLVEIVLSV